MHQPLSASQPVAIINLCLYFQDVGGANTSQYKVHDLFDRSLELIIGRRVSEDVIRQQRFFEAVPLRPGTWRKAVTARQPMQMTFPDPYGKVYEAMTSHVHEKVKGLAADDFSVVVLPQYKWSPNGMKGLQSLGVQVGFTPAPKNQPDFRKALRVK